MADYYFVSWGGLALINAALANIDGRSPLRYFLGSLVIGPLITLMLATTREAEGGALRQVDLWDGRNASGRGGVHTSR
jgi:hypothetical protein